MENGFKEQDSRVETVSEGIILVLPCREGML